MRAPAQPGTTSLFRAFFVLATGSILGLLVLPYSTLMALEARVPWMGALATWLDSLTAAVDLKHFLAFAVVGFLARLAQSRPRVLRALLFLVVFAAATEWVQYFLASRSTKLVDFVSNLGGGVLGYGAAWVAGRLWIPAFGGVPSPQPSPRGRGRKTS